MGWFSPQEEFVAKRQITVRKLTVFPILYAIDLNNQEQNTTVFLHKITQETSHEKHFKPPAKFKLGNMTSRSAA